jgi:hypothetical protein
VQVAAYAVLTVDCAMQLVGTALAVAGVVGKAPRHYAAAPTGTKVSWSIAHGLNVHF